MQAHPYSIHVAQEVLDDLWVRLRRARLPRSLGPRDGWEHGTQRSFLRDLIAYWLDGYDWREQEAQLNTYPQFRVDLEDANLHFLHVRSDVPDAMPVVLLHGWPDSCFRYYKVIPRLVRPESRRAESNGGGDGEGGGDDEGDDGGDSGGDGFAFDVVAPSLPGFPLTQRSKGTREPGQPNRHTAHLIWRLMTEVLGYPRFVVAGGDGGSVIAQILALDHPESVLAIHLTDLGWHATSVDPSVVTRPERRYLERSKKAFLADGAYAAVQATKPRSLAPALNDSPVALASWIVDRFHSWSDAGGDVERSFSKDELLTNIMLYWLTETIGSSIFHYYAETRWPSLTAAEHVARPVGVALFPKESGGVPPRQLAERTLNVRHWTEMPRGSHFAPLEQPELYARDLVDTVRALHLTK